MALIFTLIFLVAMIGVALFALYLSRNVEHGEARFDSDTGQQLKQDQAKDQAKDHAATQTPVAAQRKPTQSSDSQRSDEA